MAKSPAFWYRYRCFRSFLELGILIFFKMASLNKKNHYSLRLQLHYSISFDLKVQILDFITNMRDVFFVQIQSSVAAKISFCRALSLVLLYCFSYPKITGCLKTFLVFILFSLFYFYLRGRYSHTQVIDAITLVSGRNVFF
jgi:hypothetical protein